MTAPHSWQTRHAQQAGSTVLKDAGLVTEETEQRGRPGRPRLLYRQHPEVAERWDVPGSYAWLAGLLSAAIPRGQEPRQAGRQDGHRRAAEISSPGDPADLMELELTRRGFRPARAGRGRRLEFTLGRCPFAEVAAADPGTVCQLHLGLAEGLTDGLGQLQVERLTPRDPFEGGCRLTVQRTAAGPAAGAGPESPAPGQGNNHGVTPRAERTTRHVQQREEDPGAGGVSPAGTPTTAWCTCRRRW
jgi:predicted ArsR family transcriptional regulator